MDVRETRAVEMFLRQFDICAVSLAIQNVFIDMPDYSVGYDDTEVLQETISLEILDGGDVIATIDDPIDDYETIKEIAVKWIEAGAPTSLLPEENKKFHKFFDSIGGK